MTKLAHLAASTLLFAHQTIPLTAIAIESERQGGAPETPPDRLSVNKDSPHYNKAILPRVSVMFNGYERKQDVEEYCRSEGWIIVRKRNALTGQFSLDAEGCYITSRLAGRVEPFFKAAPPPAAEMFSHHAEDRRAAAEEKRARKAAKRARLAT